MLFLTGPAGSGKTRLARIATQRALGYGYVVSTGTCVANHGPYAPFVDALKEAAAGDLPSPVRDRLGACLARRTELAELIGWRTAAAPNPSGEPVAKDALFQALGHALILLAHTGSALVILDNFHLADEAALDFLNYMAVRIRVHRLLLLVLCRTDVEGRLTTRIGLSVEETSHCHGARRIHLGGLNVQQLDRLVRSVYRKNLFSDALRQGLLKGTGGNPSSVLEALELLQAQGLIVQEGGIWREQRASAPGGALSDLYQAVVQRLKRC